MKIAYKGIIYNVCEFTDADVHIEPCGSCCFGKLVNIGLRQQFVKGIPKMYNEGGWNCSKPKDFEPCTAPLRKDRRNVYFTYDRKEGEE